MNEIKYWIYYLKDEDKLYAYTDNKEYANAFELDRDMKLFKKIKKVMTKDEIRYLAQEFQNSVLKEVQLDIFDKDRERWFKGTFVMTSEEYFTITLIEVQLMESELYQHCWDNPWKFKIKIFKALEVLEYNNVYRQISATADNKPAEIKVKPDLLGIFLRYYGNTMKGTEK